MTKNEMLESIKAKMLEKNIQEDVVNRLIKVFSHNTRSFIESIYECWNINLTRD